MSIDEQLAALPEPVTGYLMSVMDALERMDDDEVTNTRNVLDGMSRADTLVEFPGLQRLLKSVGQLVFRFQTEKGGGN